MFGHKSKDIVVLAITKRHCLKAAKFQNIANKINERRGCSDRMG